MSKRFKPSIVIPCGENRLDNLKLVIKSILEQEFKPLEVIVVCDGFDKKKAQLAIDNPDPWFGTSIFCIEIPKHQPSYASDSDTIQPKNAGAWYLDEIESRSNCILFLDSDIILGPETMLAYKEAWDYKNNRIMIGPYDWLGEGVRKFTPEFHNEIRHSFFEDYDYTYTSVGEINFAMANFGGNIVYPRNDFRSIGGFWDDLSAGRVEDGEMGLRCASVGIPMCAVPKARAQHLEHPVNHQWKIDTNAIEVPMLDERHPWVHNHGVFVADNDGKRFEWIDPDTGIAHNTNEIWNYYDKNTRRNS
jgi:glycosyltransferase involved in cell wall biosynthesis